MTIALKITHWRCRIWNGAIRAFELSGTGLKVADLHLLSRISFLKKKKQIVNLLVFLDFLWDYKFIYYDTGRDIVQIQRNWYRPITIQRHWQRNSILRRKNIR